MPIIKYFKSAAFNNLISQKTERILKLIFLPVWGIAIVATILLLYQVGDSTRLYFKSVELKNKYQKELTKNRQDKDLRDEIRKQMIDASEHPAKGLNRFLDSINKRKPASDKPVISPEFASSLKDPNFSEEDHSSIDLKLFREVGIDDPNPYNDKMPDEAIAINSDGIKTGILYILIINSLVFLLPWLLIRGFYWIKLGDTTPI